MWTFGEADNFIALDPEGFEDFAPAFHGGVPPAYAALEDFSGGLNATTTMMIFQFIRYAGILFAAYNHEEVNPLLAALPLALMSLMWQCTAMMRNPHPLIGNDGKGPFFDVDISATSCITPANLISMKTGFPPAAIQMTFFTVTYILHLIIIDIVKSITQIAGIDKYKNQKKSKQSRRKLKQSRKKTRS